MRAESSEARGPGRFPSSYCSSTLVIVEFTFGPGSAYGAVAAAFAACSSTTSCIGRVVCGDFP